MLELLQACWNLVTGLVVSLWGLVVTVSVLAGDVLLHLHTDAPRLEGLVVGVALAWLLLRRDRHPLLRVLSAPLKLVLDVLDLAWDQVVEVASDGWNIINGSIRGVVGWCWGKISSTGSWVMNRLRALKARLKKAEE
jgi:hypothetical protein